MSSSRKKLGQKRSQKTKKKSKKTSKKYVDIYNFVPSDIDIKKRTKVKEEVKPKPTVKEDNIIKPKKEEYIKRKIQEKNQTEADLSKNELIFYKKNNEPFGELKFEDKIEKKQRESRKSRYLRYLKENNQLCKNMERGLLLTVEYCGTENKAYARFYDLKDESIKFWIDNTGHQPYCLHKNTKDFAEKKKDLDNFDGFDRIEKIKKYDLIEDKEINISKIYAKTPNVVGGTRKDSIKGILGGAWEANIRYHHNYIFDTGLIPGLIYNIKEGSLTQVETEIHPEIENQFLELYKKEKLEFQEMAKNYLRIFSNPIPDIKRVAFDIEVDSAPGGQIPNAKLANESVISVSFASNDGLNLVYVLWKENCPIGNKHEQFPSNGKIIFFENEKDLIEETFRILWKYPLVLSFNGDNFDLYYLFHRARKLKITDDLNPIQIQPGGGSMVSTYAYLRNGVHVDLYQIFANRSLKGYAFGNIYDRNSLDEITKAFLVSRKFKGNAEDSFSASEIAHLDFHTLAHYNMMDSIITLELTTFGGNSVLNLIVYLLRITKLPLQDMFRHQISFWIRSVLFFEHRVRNYLIPRQSELLKLKPGGFGKSDIEGKGFQGAYVIPPVPGIHFNTAVVDFSSLYPTIIKSRNLSYETISCRHDSCESNFLPDTPYYVCTERVGIFSLVVGFLRDIRVKWFKPRSSDKNISEEERNFAKILQAALKVFVNGSYGVFGSTRFPLYCLPVAESTTAIGRYAIKKTIEKSESMGIKVLYGDTDSIFLENPNEKQISEIIKWSTEELDIDLEHEKTYQFLALSERKKNYVGIYKDSLFVDIKGMTGKKRNTPPFIKKAFKETTEILKNIKNMDDFAKSKKNIIEHIKTYYKKIGKTPENGGFNLKDYTITIGIKKDIKDYKKNIPQHIKAAKMEQTVSGIRYSQGDTIQIIKAASKEGVKPFKLAKFRDIDSKKYKELLEATFDQLLDALNTSFEDIKGTQKIDAFF